MFKTLKGWMQLQRQEKEALESLQQQRFELEDKIKSLNENIAELSSKQSEAQKAYEDKIEQTRKVDSMFDCLMEVGYEHYVPTMQDSDLEKKIFDNELRISNMVNNDTAIIYSKRYNVDGSVSKGKKFQQGYGKSILIGFNSYVQKKTKAVTQTNYYKIRDLVANCYAKYNKTGSIIGLSINPRYLDCMIDNIKLTLELKIFRAKEREQLKEERRRAKEYEKLLEEAEKEKKRLENERKAMELAYAKALTDEERIKIKEQVKTLDKRLSDVDYRINNPKSGWVYIIHSPSLPGMQKIGVSRRLSGPYERCRELSSSSLPFPFILDGFCFSEDAFAIESAMHKHFDSVRVTPNREFFYVSAEEAISVLRDKFHQNVIISECEDNNDSYT